jgi:hypothetical protein
VDKLHVPRSGRVLAIVASALLLMLVVVLTSPPQPVETHSVGIAHEVTDTVSTDAAPQAQSDKDAPKQVTIVLGTVAMIAVVGLAFARRKPHGSDRL